MVPVGQLANAGVVLEALLAHWRAAPHAELADRIVALGATLGAPVDAASWDTVAAKHDPKDLSALLDAALDGTSTVLRGRMEQLAAWPTDPRRDRFAAHTYAHPPFTSTGARPFWTRVLALALDAQDPVARETLRIASSQWSPSVPWQEFLLGHVARVRAVELPRPAPLTAEQQALLRAADVLVAGKRGGRAAAHDIEALLDAVLTRPADDEPRRVLMDALLEQAHPRGELLALHFGAQGRALTAAEKKREKALIKQHRAELLGPLDAALGTDLGFSRGFLSRANLKRSNANATRVAIAQSVGHPLWATVEHLTGGGDAEVVCHEVMRSLVSLESSDVPLEVLAKRPGLRALTQARVSDERHVQALTGPGAFPALRRLGVVGYPWALSKMVLWPRARELEALGLEFHQSSSSPFGEEHAVLLRRALALAVPELTFSIVRSGSTRWGSTAVFDARAREVKLSVSLGNDAWQPIVLPDVLAVLEVSKALGFKASLDLDGVTETELVAKVRRAV